VCWAASEEEALSIARERWPIAAIPGSLNSDLPLPKMFEDTAKLVRPEDIAGSVSCGPDPEPHIRQIREFAEAGFDHVFIHQIGDDQEGFFRFYELEVLPAVRDMSAAV
jgi:alkanesulfonate monooxygenase SsuD/methylene tetrahydromethanopterin reductase-like flavin-dependent oxidoreductase (luciferase family)